MRSIVDLIIIFAYISSTVAIGFYIRKRASKSLDAYFLLEKSMPWYVLGITNASGMFDITGTMWLVYIMLVYGIQSAWLSWVWPMFNLLLFFKLKSAARHLFCSPILEFNPHRFQAIHGSESDSYRPLN